MAALGQAVRHGWSDFLHLAGDEDLASVRQEPGFVSLLGRGRREVALGSLEAGEVIEIDVPAPVSVVALGAYVGDDPWEGWTATVAPAGPAPTIQVDEVCEPGLTAELKIRCEQADASVHVIVKDARLQTADTPRSRLAGQIKSHVQQADEALVVQRPTERLGDQPLPHTMLLDCVPPPSSAFGGGADFSAMAGSAPPPPRPMRPSAARAPSRPAPAPMMSMPQPAPAPMMSMPQPASAPMSRPKGAAMDAPAAAPAPGGPPGGPYREPAPQPEPAQVAEDPEVLHAGLVPLEGGEGRLSLVLPDTFTDYLVEAFCVSPGLDWAMAEARFSAEKQPFAALDLPAFVHPRDTAEGRLQVGSVDAPLLVSVVRDGQPLELTLDGQILKPDQTVDGPRATIRFNAAPGDYEAHVHQVGGSGSDHGTGRVEEPGKLRSRAVAVQVLQPGQRLNIADIEGAMTLRVLPGLRRPFNALVDATGDYGHACCEQTAAKILAALAMLVMSRDAARRARAVAIILAGIQRQRRMWLPGRGFKMYPDSHNSPNEYWGTKAALYLQQLALAPREGELGEAVAEALKMANDACRAYGLQWPPPSPRTCEQAYALARFGQEPAALTAAIRLINGQLHPQGGLPPGALGGMVGMRAEGAYAAACLLRAGQGELGRALNLTNEVVKHLGPSGRLYSTVDSVAAIALMMELRAAGVVNEGTAAGTVKVNGRQMPLSEATRLVEQIEEVEAGQGVVAVEVTRLIEENWEDFAAGVSLRVALERDGKARRTVCAGDALDLHVTIDEGYKAGDLLWVCLPDCLSRVVGGGQVKRFSVDFEEQPELRIPLAVTGVTPHGRQHFAVCLRNMFEEERAGSPGLLDVTVS